MTLSTKFFESLANAAAKGKGMPETPQAILPFPLETLPEKDVRAHARQSFAAVVGQLTGAAPKVPTKA